MALVMEELLVGIATLSSFLAILGLYIYTAISFKTKSAKFTLLMGLSGVAVTRRLHLLIISNELLFLMLALALFFHFAMGLHFLHEVLELAFSISYLLLMLLLFANFLKRKAFKE